DPRLGALALSRWRAWPWALAPPRRICANPPGAGATPAADTAAPDPAPSGEPTELMPVWNHAFEELARGLSDRLTSSAADKDEDAVTEFDQGLLPETEAELATAGEIRLILDRCPVG